MRQIEICNCKFPFLLFVGTIPIAAMQAIVAASIVFFFKDLKTAVLSQPESVFIEETQLLIYSWIRVSAWVQNYVHGFMRVKWIRAFTIDATDICVLYDSLLNLR